MVYAPFGARPLPVLAFPELHGTLADVARRGCRNKLPSYPVAGELAQQCLEGLARVHQCRVVHRDLSPINILVDLGPCANTGRMQLIVNIADCSRARVLPVEEASTHTVMEQREGPDTHAMTTRMGHCNTPFRSFCLVSQGISTGSPWTFGRSAQSGLKS